ncbi:hypothetical protein K0U07_05115 [bacterium]|nr:hypothetical protein [bacterium]
MKYKPFLLQNKARGSFVLVHIDTDKVKTMKPMYDSFQTITTTPNSPLKNLTISQNK